MKRLVAVLLIWSAATIGWAAPAYKGMSITSFNATEYAGANSDQSFVNMSMLGTDTVAINFWWYQSAADSTTMAPTGSSATEAAVGHAIDQAHSLGMKVMLKPMLDIQGGLWRANIEPSDPDAWFQNYASFINTYANMAQAKGVELYSIGCEFNRLEDPANTQRWTDLIADVRTHYTGPLTYAANWNSGGIGGGYDILPWWGQLDYIGIDAYFPVTGDGGTPIPATNNPSLAQMQTAWTTRANSLEQWRIDRGLTDKQVIFTEVGLSSYDGSNITPYDGVSEHPGAAADELEQYNGYEALLSVMTQREWFDGAFWWNWEANPTTSSQTSFTPQWKLAQDVLANYYSGVLPAFPTSSWNTNSSGSFGTGANWNNNTVPNSIYVATFNRGAAVAYDVTLNTTTRTVGQLRVGSNTVTFTSSNATVRNITADDWHIDEVNRGVIIGVNSGDVAVVNTTNTFGTLTARAATIGDAAGANGTLNLSNSVNLFDVIGAHSAYWEFIVGRAGTGALNITNGARVTVRAAGAASAMGVLAGSSGTATVSGTGSLWSTTVALRVGLEGQALLTVSNGGTVSAPTIVVGPLGEVRGDGNLTGNVQNNGHIAPGTSPGTLHISGNYTQTSDGDLSIQLASLSSFDVLQVGGIATLAGALNVTFLDEYMPSLNDSFTFLTSSSAIMGEFTNFDLPDLDPGLGWQVAPVGTSMVLSVVEAGLTGDYNGDNIVDAADYSIWRDSFGSTTNLAADGDDSGTIDDGDYDVWKMHFGESLGGPGAGAASANGASAVPEPGSLILLVATLILFAFRRTARRSG